MKASNRCIDEVRESLSLGQRALWVYSQAHPRSAAYNTPALLRMRGPVDAGVLQGAFQSTVDRHEMLRSAFDDRDGMPFRVVSSDVVASLDEIDLRGGKPLDVENVALLTATKLARVPFELRSAPLMRVHLLRLADDVSWILLNFHHIVADAWSIAVVIGDLTQFCGSARSGDSFASTHQSPVERPYRDFVEWQHDWASSAERVRLQAEWRDALRDAEPLDLPGLRVDSRSPSVEGESIAFFVPRPLVDRLRHVAREQGASVFSSLLLLVTRPKRRCSSRCCGRIDLTDSRGLWATLRMRFLFA